MLGDLLGRGGMAEVFAGHAVGDHGFQKPVAIKRLLPELANDEVFVDRLIEEAKLLVGMQHGNIVSVLDLAREGDDVFLVMEFVDGPSLRQLIKSRGARGLSLGVTSYIIQSAAAGLEFAHARPGGAIIHADISPSNLLLTTSGEVRVADFGIARREGLGQGVVEGKWAYMAPEQARGEPLTPASDVFALGVVLYELLTGKHPFGQAVTANQRDALIAVAPPRAVRPTVTPGLDEICMRALAHDPRDRYGRMQHMIDAIVEERFASGYREGAADLAQAIRDGAPSLEASAPRTMHTGRPVTLMTRSLLRELTPPPATGMLTTPRPGTLRSELTGDGLPTRPSSPSAGASGYLAEQVALAQAAAALLEIPAALRPQGEPLPPFRPSHAALPGDELASVVGGHTVAGQAAIAVENRGHRWTIGVLAAAALSGVIAAIAIQVSPESAASPAPAGEVAVHTPAPAPASPPTAPVEPRPATKPPTAPATAPVAPPVTAPVEPTPSAAPAATSGASIVADTDAAPAAPAPDAPAKPDTAGAEARTGQARPSPKRSAAVSGRVRGEPGILSVQTMPWAWVTVGEQTKETPGAKFTLSPGSYVVKFYNEVNGVTKLKRVTIEPGRMLKLNVDMER